MSCSSARSDRRAPGAAAQRLRPLVRALALALLAAGCSHTGPPAPVISEVGTAALMRPAASWGDDGLWLRLQGPDRQLVLVARWRGEGTRIGGFSYHEARLEQAGDTDWPPPAGRPAAVLGPESWRELMRSVVERLAPAQPNYAALVLLPHTELAVFRDVEGTLRVTRLEDCPPGTRLTARFDESTFAAEMAAALAEGLGGLPPGEQRVVLATDVPASYLAFDTGRGLCLAVTAPAADQASTPVVMTLKGLDGLFIRSHLITLIKNPVSTVFRLISQVVQTLGTFITFPIPDSDDAAPPLGNAEPMDLAAFERRLDALVEAPVYRGSVRLLIDGDEYFPHLVRRIAEAQKSVYLRVNIFDNDDVAFRIAEQLRERAREVDVRVLTDRLSSLIAWYSAPATPMPADFRMPVDMANFLERDSRLSVRLTEMPWFTADHSKVFVFDRRFAHLGGMNIGREYRHEWHDLMVELEGPVVGALHKDFLQAWSHTGLGGDIAYAWRSLTSTEGFEGDAERDDYMDVRPLYTLAAEPQIYLAQLEAAKAARRYIYIENTYLFDNLFVAELIRARRRGVDVRVILPRDSDLGLSDGSNRVTANVLAANGILVYVYPGMTHVKAAAFDGWACLGSANFNKLSFKSNRETNIATSDPRFVDELLRRVFEVDFARSPLLEEAIEVRWTDRAAQSIMNQF
jgi:phosphatidylserine/phosphatidylglycerophosphate/cardiolipin synthase-like enzyme